MRELTMGQAYAEAVRIEMERDPRVFVMGTDIYDRGGHFAQLKGIGELFGRERVRDTPISEAAMMGTALGAAMTGMRPIIDLNFLDFILGAMDEVINQIAKIRYTFGGQVTAPLVIRASSGVAVAAGPQHSHSLEAWFAHIPGLVVVAPATPADAKGLLASALRGDDPVLYLMHKMLGGTKGPVPEGEHLVPLGRAEVKRAGDDVTVVAYSATLLQALAVAEELAEEEISCEVIDLRTVVPIDFATIAASLTRTGRLVITHEATEICGIGAEIAAYAGEHLFDQLDAPITRVAGATTPVPFSPVLQRTVVPSNADIARAIRNVVAA